MPGSRSYEMPDSAKVMGEITKKDGRIGWPIDGRSAEMLCKKYDWKDQDLCRALKEITALPPDIITIFRENNMPIEWIESELFDTCNGDIDAFRKAALAHADMPFDKTEGGE